MKCHLSRQISALLCLLFVAAIVALVPVQADDAVTLILQSGRDGYAGVEDTYLYQYAPNANYCQTSDIRVGYRQQFAGLLHFDLASVPDGARIVGASLELYARGWGGQDMNVQAFRLLRTANPCQATWNQADLGVEWGTPGAAAPGVDRPASPESSVDTRGVSKWYTWDITALVQDWVDGALPNDGVLLRGDSSWKPSIFFFASTQEPAQSMRPRLIITYLPPLEPTPTSSPTPPPQAPWPMFRHDAQHTGVSPYTGPSSLTLRWRLQTDGPVHSSPAVAFDGTVYVGSGDGHVYALNADGTIRWRYDTGEPVESSPALGPDGAIYVGSDSGFLYALNPDGTLRWRFATLDVVQSSPVVGTDGAIYVGSDDGRLYAVNPDGTERWRHDTVTLPPYPQLLSSPALAEDGTVYIATGRDAYLDAVNPDGTLKWHVFMSSKWARGAPAVGPDGVVYAGSDAGCLHAYDADGNHVWSCGGELPYLAIVQSSPAVGPDGTVYFGTDMRYAGPPYGPGYLYALNPDGTQKWALPTDGPVLSSPALGADGTVYVGCHDGYLYAAGPDGSLQWAFWVGSALHSSPAVGPDNTVYIGAEDGGVYAIGPAEGTVTLTLQQGLDGYEGATDTFIYQYEPYANHCTDNGFRVGYKQQNAALLRFDLSPIPAGSRVETAVLRVHARGWSALLWGSGSV